MKYYHANTVRVAMRKGDGQALFLLGDHLGSTNRLVHADGTPLTPGGMRLYKAWGELRYEPDGVGRGLADREGLLEFLNASSTWQS